MGTRRLVVAACAIPFLPLLAMCGPEDPGLTVARDFAASPVGPSGAVPVEVAAIADPVMPSLGASRVGTDDTDDTAVTMPAPTYVLPPSTPAGLWGMPFAPDGYDDCAQAEFYRQQWQLPEQFIRITWRESRCINREDVRTSCCVSRYQLYVGLHLRNPELALRYEACQVFDESDLDGPQPIEQQRAACATKALFDLNGMAPWRMP